MCEEGRLAAAAWPAALPFGPSGGTEGVLTSMSHADKNQVWGSFQSDLPPTLTFSGWCGQRRGGSWAPRWAESGSPPSSPTPGLTWFCLHHSRGHGALRTCEQGLLPLDPSSWHAGALPSSSLSFHLQALHLQAQWPLLTDQQAQSHLHLANPFPAHKELRWPLAWDPQPVTSPAVASWT